MGHNLSSDLRPLNCKHERLRQALEFRPAHARTAVATPAPAALSKPALNSDLEVQLERTTPAGFLAGAVSMATLALIWTLLTCVVDMSC